MEENENIYSNLNYQEAVKLLNNRFNAKNPTLPPLKEIQIRRQFDAGDSWQNGNGYIGQMPTGEYAAERTQMLKNAFSPEDLVSEVLSTHNQNVLGEEPVIEIESEDLTESEKSETLEIVKQWYKKRGNTNVLAKSLRAARREQSSLLRVFIPSGMVDGESGIAAKNLEDALSKIWIRSEPIEMGGVVIDEETATELGLFLYKMKVGNQDVSLCEKSFLQESGGEVYTIWGTVSAHTQSVGAEDAEPLLLGGHLPIYQMDIEPFISFSTCAAQRGANLSGTMRTKNVNRAGDLETFGLGIEPPGEWIDTGETDAEGNKIMELKPKEIKTGAGRMNFFATEKIFDPVTKGITHVGNPNIVFRDPVKVSTFIETSEYCRYVIYSKAKQRHILAGNDGRINGISRIQMRKEFQASLQESETVINPAGSWSCQVPLHIAAHFMGKKGKYLKTKVIFKAQVATIELTPEERRELREDFKARAIDLRTYLEQSQYKNVDEIIDRLKGKENNVLPPPDLNGGAESVQ